jgi:hypothetical protein
MNGAAAGLLARHRALEKHCHRRRPAEQLVDGNNGGHRTRAAAADPARQR